MRDLLGVRADPTPVDLLDLFDELQVQAVGVHDVAGGVGTGDDGGTQLR